MHRLFFPLEVSRGENKLEPFGYRTILDWTILGSNTHKSEIADTEKKPITCLHGVTDTEESSSAVKIPFKRIHFQK